MTEEMEEYREQVVNPVIMPLRRRPLPNATTILVLGICSVVLGCFAVGLVTGIIGLVLSRKSKAIYRDNPELYDDYGNLQAGFILSIIGICIGGLATLYYMFIFLVVLFGGTTGAVSTSGYTV
ncbi:MAG: hypothetical protein JO301_04090 [Chitinophagaceae bacterium]|nr:hypothetical protein [Chitinophagaceae bacterium]